jgi:hypothetical protein
VTQNTVYMIIRQLGGVERPCYAYRSEANAKDACGRLNQSNTAEYRVEKMWLED